MSLQAPTAAEVSANIIAQIEAAIGQTVPLLPKAFVRVLAKVFAGVIVLLFKYCGFIFLQLFVAHATMEEVTILGRRVRPLVEWGRLIGVGDPLAAERAQVVVTVTVTNQTGSLKAGTKVVRTENGVIYSVVAERALNAPSVQVTLRATASPNGGDGSGTIGNLSAGDKLQFANPIPNVAREVTVVSQTVQGADAEAVESYRARIFKRFQRRPQGGAVADYDAWAGEVPGIVNVYPYAGNLPGEVDVYCEATEASSGSPDGIPTVDQRNAVRDAIEFEGGVDTGTANRRPVNAAVNVLPITRTGFTVTITGLNPNTPENRAEIKEGLEEYFLAREPFIVGLSTLPRDDRVTAAALGGIVNEIASAKGATVNGVSVVPGASYTLGRGEKAKLSGDPVFT